MADWLFGEEIRRGERKGSVQTRYYKTKTRSGIQLLVVLTEKCT